MLSRQVFGLLVLSVVLVTTTGSTAEKGLSRDDMLRELSDLIPPGTISESHVMNSNGFTLAYDRYKQLGTDLKPNGKELQSIVVSASGAFNTQVVRGVLPTIDNGVSIYHRESGTPLLVLGDANGDGQPDFLSYSSADANGQITMTATDYDMDGQPDERIHLAQRYSEIWNVDHWYKVETRDGSRGIMMNDKFVELRKENGRWRVP
jgi:hypothetical protein